MTDNNTPTERERPGKSTDTTSKKEVSVTQSRRRLLGTLTSSGAVLLAGCGKTGSGTPTGTRGDTSSQVVDQTFRAPVEYNPARISFYAPWERTYLKSPFAVTSKEQVSGKLLGIVRELCLWTDKLWVGGNIHYTWLKNITVTPTEVTVTVRDDATWSDGNPITGRDIAMDTMKLYLRNPFPAYFATEEKEEPTVYWDAIDGFEISDRSVTYRSSPGYFEKWWDWTLKTIFGLWHSAGATVPTHIKPYDGFAKAVLETARRAQEGEINPWKGWNDPRVRPDDPHAESLIQKHLAKEGKYVAKFSNPENVLSTSAWDLVEINGPEAVFEPNPYHRNAKDINFDRVILEYTPSEERGRAALSADQFDYASPGPVPEAVVDSLHEPITELQIPGGGGSGNELKLNFNHPDLGKRKVRMAIMYALDQSRIANNIHQSAALPVTTPGGDCWDTSEYVSDEWVEKNLTTYPQNIDKATALMREAGYTKEREQWLDSDGEPFTLTLPTKSETPRWEPTVASQLSEFGIDMSVQQLDETRFRQRLRNGQFSIWADSGTATSIAAYTLLFWRFVPWNPEIYGIYPRKQYATGKFSDLSIPIPRTEERYDVFTIKAPPIGKPNGALHEHHPSALAMAFFSNPPEEEFRRRVKITMWLANWLLPTIPINKTLEQHFIDETHWQWPTDTPSWQTFANGGSRTIGGIFASGTLRANPDNPEK